MEKNNESSISQWVDERIAGLDAASEWQPNTIDGLARLERRREAANGRLPRWIWAGVAAGAAGFCLMAFPAVPRAFAQRCLDCSVALWQTLSPSNSVRLTVPPDGTRAMAPSNGAEAGAPPEAQLQIPALDGMAASVGQYKGKVVLVNFWATWCEACNIEIPWLIEFNQKFAARGLVILGVAMDEEGRRVVQPWVESKHYDVNGHPELMNYRILLGDSTIADGFGATIGLPTSFLYARDGRKVKTIFGLTDYRELEKILEAQL